MNEIKYKIYVKLGYIKKEEDGEWIDNLDKPCLTLMDKYKKFKIPIQNVSSVIEDMKECLKVYEGCE